MVIGCLEIYSVALSHPTTHLLFLKKQLIAAAVGGVLFWTMLRMRYQFLKGYSLVFYVATLFFLGAVLFLGKTNRGTTGWFELGIFSFQPVEYAKFALVVILAQYLSRRGGQALRFRDILITGLYTAIPVVLVLFQPDFGSAFLLCSLWGLMMLFGGLKRRHLLFFLCLIALVPVGIWKMPLAPYQRDRIETFLHPSSAPAGKGYNVHQALIAVGSGQLTGRGAGFGSQSQLKFLPESHTDFIFSVIAEELGFLGVSLVLVVFFVFFSRVLFFACTAVDPFARFLLFGSGSILFVQFVINVGMNIGLFPVTGITLPFVSYGGSSLVFSLLMVGIIEGVISHLRRSSVSMSSSTPLSSPDLDGPPPLLYGSF